jgi:hypothetical protein
LQQRKEYHAGAVFWSPCKIREARACEAVLQQQEHEDKLAKANRKELQAAAKLLKEQEKEDCRVARERAKEVRDQMKAEQAAARAAKIAAQNTKKNHLQLPKQASVRPYGLLHKRASTRNAVALLLMACSP